MRTAIKICFASVTLAANAFLWLAPHGTAQQTEQAGMFNPDATLDTSQVIDDRPVTSIAYQAHLAGALGRVNVAHLRFMATHDKYCGDVCQGG
jgi:hypothetical protein